jgi:myo-inositol-1(or 4)-monophosphatase
MVKLYGDGIEDLTGFARDVIYRSGKESLAYYGRGKSDVQFDEELITEAELSLRKFFQDQMNVHFPEHTILGNDQKKMSYTHGPNRYLWIYDPLDGVANFQAGIPIWGTSLALLENFWPIFGAFYMPATGDFFHARAGQKGFRGETEISISNQKKITDESLLLTYSRFHQSYHSTFPGKIRNLGCTAAHICYVAMGRAEAAVIANESYQGLAAALIIIEAAGGKIYKMDGGDFYLNEYLNGQKIDDHLLAAGPEICSQIRDYLKAI